MARKHYATDTKSLEEDTELDFYRGSGPGGQRRNRKETGVRIHHVPSGIIVECDETRSQANNRELAFERLRAALVRLNKPKKPRIPTKPPLSAEEQRIKTKKIQGRKKEQRKPPKIEPWQLI